MQKKFVSYLRHQSFQPKVSSIFLNPFYFIRHALFTNFRELAPSLQGKLIDLGCGRKPYENLFNVSEYIGIDIEHSGHDHSNSKIDVLYDGSKIPFANQTFDSAFCSEVLEHVFNPEIILPELNRVLKNNARVLISVPFCWNEHEIPYDYARYTSYGLPFLLEKNGFKIIETRKTGSFTRVIWQLIILYIFEVFKKLGKLGYVLSLIFIIPLNILGAILIPLTPKNTSLFFNVIVLAEKAESTS